MLHCAVSSYLSDATAAEISVGSDVMSKCLKELKHKATLNVKQTGRAQP